MARVKSEPSAPRNTTISRLLGLVVLLVFALVLVAAIALHQALSARSLARNVAEDVLVLTTRTDERFNTLEQTFSRIERLIQKMGEDIYHIRERLAEVEARAQQ